MNTIFLQFKAYFYAMAVLIVGALFVGTFFFGIHYEKLESQAEIERQRIAFQILTVKEQSRYDDIATKFIDRLENIKIVNTTVNKNFTKEILNTVYKDCVIPVTGVQLLNDTAKQLNSVRTTRIVK